MNILIDNRSDRELPLSRIEELVGFVLEREGANDKLELSVSFVTLDEIIELNTIYRDKPEPTDVLSFELDDPWAEVDEDDAGTILLGDIVINPELAKQRTLQEELSFEEELWFLVIHGILHLLGFDHLEELAAIEMEAREDEHFYQWELKLGVL
jgi:probable rRNA maturation factor